MPVLATIRRMPVSSLKGCLLGIAGKKAILKTRRLETYLLLLPLPIVPHAPSFFLPFPQPPHDTKRPLRRREEAEYTPQGQGHSQPGVCPGGGGGAGQGGFKHFRGAGYRTRSILVDEKGAK